MIKVLHFTSSFGLSGGAEANLLRLVSHMDRDRFSNMIVTMTEGVNFDLVRERLSAEFGVAVDSAENAARCPKSTRGCASVSNSQPVPAFSPGQR